MFQALITISNIKKLQAESHKKNQIFKAMFDHLFILLYILNNDCSPLVINIQINEPMEIKYFSFG